MSWFKRKDNKNKEVSEKLVTKTTSSKASQLVAVDKKFSGILRGVIHPLSSEKSVRLQSLGQYTFVVSKDLSKVQLKKDIEKTYGVKVEKVTSVNLPSRIVYNRGREGVRSARRYLHVKLAKGQTIDLTKF